MIRLFVLALTVWALLLAFSVFVTFYLGLGAGIACVAVLLGVTWLLARRIEREGQTWRDSL